MENCVNKQSILKNNDINKKKLKDKFIIFIDKDKEKENANTSERPMNKTDNLSKYNSRTSSFGKYKILIKSNNNIINEYVIKDFVDKKEYKKITQKSNIPKIKIMSKTKINSNQTEEMIILNGEEEKKTHETNKENDKVNLIFKLNEKYKNVQEIDNERCFKNTDMSEFNSNVDVSKSSIFNSNKDFFEDNTQRLIFIKLPKDDSSLIEKINYLKNNENSNVSSSDISSSLTDKEFEL